MSVLLSLSSRKRRWDQPDQAHATPLPAAEKRDPEPVATNPKRVEMDSKAVASSVSEIAAKINASLAAKGVQLEDSAESRAAPNEELSSAMPNETLGPTVAVDSGPSLTDTLGLDQPKVEKNIDYSTYTFKDTVDVNDTRHRYYISRASTLEEVLDVYQRSCCCIFPC